MDWETIGLIAMGIGFILYMIFFDLIIEKFGSLMEYIADVFERMPRTCYVVVHSYWLRIIQIVVFTALLTAFSSEVFADQKAPHSGAFFI